MKIVFSKVREDAKIPSKRVEDAGYDIYACFDEDYIVIEPSQSIFVPTGIASAFPNNYVALLRERGSTGSKQMALRCGVIDAGFRGEWKVAINNTSEQQIVIVKAKFVEENPSHFENMKEYCTVYPYEKAIAQFIFTNAFHAEIIEIPHEKLEQIKSERGTGMLGSSGA